MSEGAVAVRCDEVSRSYRTESETVDALVDCSVQLATGELAVISGRSGSGKSTLLRVLAALDEPSSGGVWLGERRVDGMPVRARQRIRRKLVTYIFQRPADNFVSFLSVADHLRLSGERARSQQQRVLEELDLAGTIDQLPGTLSGGEQQRAAFAQAIVAGRQIVVADEPTAELDHESADHVLRALKTLAESGACVVVASHDERVAAIAGSSWRLSDGRLSPEEESA